MATPAFRTVHVDELRDRIDAERLDAAESEFQRHDRMRLATMQVLAGAARELEEMLAQPFSLKPEELRTVAGTIEGVIELLKGEWIKSPRQMAKEKR
jgi:hypothetical protein